MCMSANPQFSGWPQVSESLEQRKETLFDEEREKNIKNRDTSWDLAKLGKDLWYGKFEPDTTSSKTWVASDSLEKSDTDDTDAIDSFLALSFDDTSSEQPKGDTPTIPSENTSNTQDTTQKNTDVIPSDMTEAQEIHESPESLEGVHSPLVNMLEKTWRITPEESLMVKEFLSHWWQPRDISSLHVPNRNTREQVIDFLTYTNSESATQQAQKLFKNHFEAELWEITNTQWEFNNQREQETYDMIASQYFPIGEEVADPTIKKLALNTAFETAYNMEIDGKQFDRTKEQIVQLTKKIKNGELSIKERFTAFLQLRQIIDTSEWRAGEKQAKSFRNMKTKAGEKQKQDTFRKAQEERITSEENAKNEEILLTEEQSTTPTPSPSGDVFTAWALDSANSGVEDVTNTV